MLDDVAGVVAEQAAGGAEQHRRIAGAHLLRAVAEYQPGEFFGVRQFRVGNQPDNRAASVAADLDAGFDGQPLAHGADIEGRVVEQALEAEDAAFDLQLLAVGSEAAVAGTDGAGGAGQVATAGGDLQLPAQAGAQAAAVEEEERPGIGAEIEVERRAQRGRRRVFGIAAADNDIVGKPWRTARRQLPVTGIRRDFAAQPEAAALRCVLPRQPAIAGEHYPLVVALPGAEAVEPDVERRPVGAAGAAVDRHFARNFQSTGAGGEAGNGFRIGQAQRARGRAQAAVEEQAFNP